MTTLTYRDPALQSRSRSAGTVRIAFDRLFGMRHQDLRRHATTPWMRGTDRLDATGTDRRSLFDVGAPERR